ncbi:hypothetical protein OC861_004409 [Tilletia horrida]|nr:hypothetical protein OC861_004409 [Tilletia horrida]
MNHAANSPSEAKKQLQSQNTDASSTHLQNDRDPEKDAHDPTHSDDDTESTRLYGFWAPELAKQRKEYLINIARLTLLISLLVWGVFSIYWGSLWKTYEHTGALTAWIINRDSSNGLIGNTISEVLLNSTRNNEPMHLKWVVVNPNDYPTYADVEYAIAAKEDAWIAVEITQDLTNQLALARANGDASWSPQGKVNLFYSEARANTAIPGLVLSPTQRRVQQAIGEVSAMMAGEYLASIAGNATALTALARAPQTIGSPLAATPVNLRPWNQPVATAPTFVGLIYIVILSLNVTMGNFTFRQNIQKRLKFSSLVYMRFLVPIVVYLVLSFMYTMLNLPFKLDFNGWHLGFGAGFMAFVVSTWVGMIVLGLVVECAISIVGPQFIGFFLVLWIIANVAVVVYPIPLTGVFFRYGYALPFPHLKSIYTTIVFNTGKHINILYHFGVLWAWLVVLLVTFPVWIWLERRRALKAARS